MGKEEDQTSIEVFSIHAPIKIGTLLNGIVKGTVSVGKVDRFPSSDILRKECPSV